MNIYIYLLLELYKIKKILLNKIIKIYNFVFFCIYLIKNMIHVTVAMLLSRHFDVMGVTVILNPWDA